MQYTESHALFITKFMTPTTSIFGIILGEQLRRDGELVPEFMIRLNIAVSDWKKGRFQKFLLTGGETAPGKPTEAEAAYDWLVRYHGIPSEDIVLEKKSITTSQNINFTSSILKEHQVVQVFIYGRRSQKRKTGVFVRRFWSNTIETKFICCPDYKNFCYRAVDQTIAVIVALLDPKEQHIAAWLNRRFRHLFIAVH